MKSLEELKNELIFYSAEYVQNRIDSAKRGLKEAQESGNSESKSSMGDKYETGRAMSQLEQEKYSKQLEEALKLKRMVDQLKETAEENKKIGPGSLVQTNYGFFFLYLGLGQYPKDKNVFLISPVAPLASQFIGKGIGDKFAFNSRNYEILKFI